MCHNTLAKLSKVEQGQTLKTPHTFVHKQWPRDAQRWHLPRSQLRTSKIVQIIGPPARACLQQRKTMRNIAQDKENKSGTKTRIYGRVGKSTPRSTSWIGVTLPAAHVLQDRNTVDMCRLRIDNKCLQVSAKHTPLIAHNALLSTYNGLAIVYQRR